MLGIAKELKRRAQCASHKLQFIAVAKKKQHWGLKQYMRWNQHTEILGFVINPSVAVLFIFTNSLNYFLSPIFHLTYFLAL